MHVGNESELITEIPAQVHHSPLIGAKPVEGRHFRVRETGRYVMQTEQLKEQERLKWNRGYFEDGCSCIHTTKTLQPCPTAMSDFDAVVFYEKNCKCTRNYVQS